MTSPKENKQEHRLLDLLLDDHYLARIVAFLVAFATLIFGIGFYFGDQHETYQHTSEINYLNFVHLKELMAEKEKVRLAEDKLNEQNITELKASIANLQQRMDEKN